MLGADFTQIDSNDNLHLKQQSIEMARSTVQYWSKSKVEPRMEWDNVLRYGWEGRLDLRRNALKASAESSSVIM